MDKLKQAALAAIDANRDKIIEIGRHIFQNPELGYKEHKTSAYVQAIFDSMALPFTTGHGITGVKARAKGAESRATVCLMGELDAVVCPTHPNADPQTGAAHACGHNGQIASMLGAAMGLLPIMNELCGDVVFFAVPAEEFVEIEYRESLQKRGEISYLGGKQQLIAEGAFDDVDMAMMVHSMSGAPGKVLIPQGGLGFIGKTVCFKGRAAHAATPHEGVNALNAAMASMMCIHSLRETFRDEDHVRVHPILTKGGDLVNVVPADVRMETYVRASHVEAMRTANVAVTRAIKGATYAVGAEVEIKDFKGYVPLQQNEALSDLFESNTIALLGEEAMLPTQPFFGSTDAGDLGTIMPVLQPTVSGFSGAAHSAEFAVNDEEWAYIIPAKLLAMQVVDLLANGAEKALHIKQTFPRGTKEDYEAMWTDILPGSIFEGGAK